MRPAPSTGGPRQTSVPTGSAGVPTDHPPRRAQSPNLTALARPLPRFPRRGQGAALSPGRTGAGASGPGGYITDLLDVRDAPAEAEAAARAVGGAGDCGRGAACSPARPCERARGRARCPRAWAWGRVCAPPPGLAPSVRGSLPPARCCPQPPPPSPGTKRLRGGAEPAALTAAGGDGRAPSSDSSGQPPIRPQETESPCLASSHRLPADPAPSPAPHPPRCPGLHPALSPTPLPFHSGCPGAGEDPLGTPRRSLSAGVRPRRGGASGGHTGVGASSGVGAERRLMPNLCDWVATAKKKRRGKLWVRRPRADTVPTT